MNNRILEIAHEAGFVDYSVHNRIESKEQVLAKFAELIVGECLRCCEQVISDPVPESVDTWLNGGTQCIDEIREHFGVEE
ncbi:hypothetical protein UFOVP49_81 [uncultured Caudovirales phage]|uniref:Uncharacterized protein n=1 Tax=uncultured Caudovirales phage TaxID=2100421 RepID=A0A6J5KT88_9CAUD|nr:hypothetical protein UFOVP49_81 [uncultured Caudovirales phage]